VNNDTTAANSQAMDNRSVAHRKAALGLDRAFDMSHYLPGHNAFTMAAMQAGKPVMTDEQLKTRDALDRKNKAAVRKRGAALKTQTQTILRVNPPTPHWCEPSGLAKQAKEIRAEMRKTKPAISSN